MAHQGHPHSCARCLEAATLSPPLLLHPCPCPSGEILSIAFLPGPLPSHISDDNSSSSGSSSSAAAREAKQPPQQQQAGAPQQERGPLQVVLLCGEDLLESMARPGAWHRPDYILEHYGVVCVAREGGRVRQMMEQPGNLLHSYRDRITLLTDPVPNSISATRVREELAAGRPVRYLVPEPVRRYIERQGLYGCRRAGA